MILAHQYKPIKSWSTAADSQEDQKYCPYSSGQGIALAMKLQMVGRDYKKVGHFCYLADYNLMKSAVAARPILKTHATHIYQP